VSEVDLSIDARFSWRVEEVGDEGERVTVFLCEFIKAAVVDA
jgi:hypothetical protein